MGSLIGSITTLEMEVAKQERRREERRKTKRLHKAQKADLEAKGAAAGGVFGPSAGIVGMGEAGAVGGRVNNRDVIAGRSVPVNLGEELYGSLRQLRTQGSVLLDKVCGVCVKRLVHMDHFLFLVGCCATLSSLL